MEVDVYNALALRQHHDEVISSKGLLSAVLACLLREPERSWMTISRWDIQCLMMMRSRLGSMVKTLLSMRKCLGIDRLPFRHPRRDASARPKVPVIEAC